MKNDWQKAMNVNPYTAPTEMNSIGRFQFSTMMLATGVLKVSEEMLNEKERLKRNGWNIDRIAETVSKKFSIKKAELFKKGRESNASRARMIVAYLATQKLGMSHTLVAEYLRVSKSAIIRAARKGELLDGKYNIEATIK